jgi:hypothetical protein
MIDAMREIQRERIAQIVKGWTPKHDDEHSDGSLLTFARMMVEAAENGYTSEQVELPESDDDWVTPAVCRAMDKHPDPIGRLRIAGALIVAEMERLSRLTLSPRMSPR